MSFKYFLINIFYYYYLINLTKASDITDWYTAAVIEFRPIKPISNSTNRNNVLSENVKAYKELIYAPEIKNVDIIVFPEGALNDGLELTYVPSESDNIIPCLAADDNTFADFFIQLSCAARQVRKYVVINLTEKEICTNSIKDKRPCAKTGLNIYNTNVAFDRYGRVISRYRKWHVYLEGKNTTVQPEYGIFETDFGVRFGHFICFDILFYTPAQALVEHYKLTDIIFTTRFYSELPFLTAVQLQQGWSWGNNVNFLAAGFSDPLKGSTGSGIYAGKQGAMIAVMVNEFKGDTKILIARLPKNIKNFKRIENGTENLAARKIASVKHLRLLKDPNLQQFNTILLNMTKNESTIKGELCHGNFCCLYEIHYNLIPNMNFTNFINFTNSYYYRFGIFNGSRTYEKREWNNIQVCSIFTCTNQNISSCGDPLDSIQNPFINFNYISINGTFQKTKELLIMPTSLDYNYYPLKADFVFWNKIDKRDYYEVHYNLQRQCDNLLTFGIYANYYDTVPTQIESNPGNTSIISAWSLTICIMSLLLTKIGTILGT